MPESLDPVVVLGEIAYLMERVSADSRRVMAFRRAAGALASMSPDEFGEHERAGDWLSVPGVGKSSAAIIGQALTGRVPARLAELRDQRRPLVKVEPALRAQLRGDLHVHSEWSDGSVSVEEMMLAACALGHEYGAITDHSPRLRVARGLSADRLRDQLALVASLNGAMGGFTVLSGIETDILDDGSLDQDPGLLDELDVVVASVHSKLTMDSESMTHRMVAAVANPRTNVLGHCTGRLVAGERGLRGPASFDAEVVFEACRQFDVAVEINSRPERRDPPTRLLELARDSGCLFSIDTDAHAPGQLEFLSYGAERAEAAGIDPDRIVTTWPLQRLRGWLGRR